MSVRPHAAWALTHTLDILDTSQACYLEMACRHIAETVVVSLVPHSNLAQ